jgi:hypothetical protein
MGENLCSFFSSAANFRLAKKQADPPPGQETDQQVSENKCHEIADGGII